MSCAEEMLYQNAFKNAVKTMRPDFVLVYGGWPMERDCYRWLKDQNIPSIFYLANPNYSSPDTFRDIHTIITDSEATARLYKERIGLTLLPFEKFVSAVKVDPQAQRNFVTFINPSPEKGVSVFIGIATEAKRRGLHVQFLVVESKSKLADSVKALGLAMEDFPGITCIPMQEDMNKVWSRTRVLLSPSLWHESGPRTVVEACSAGIPAIATDSGGAPEFLGDPGFLFPVPAEVKSNYSKPITDETAKTWTDVLEKLLSDEAFYDSACARTNARWQVLREREPVARLEALLENMLCKTDQSVGA